MTAQYDIRPEITLLNRAQRRWILRHLQSHRASCRACGSHRFRVGGALYLGFLFASEDQDAYLVALTCENPRCPNPRTALTVRQREWQGR